jgi:hypothetical protein
MVLKKFGDAIESEQRAAKTWTNQKVFFKSPALLWTAASLLLFLGVEGLVFRLGWYNKYLEPNSSAGSVESHLYWLRRFPHRDKPEVIVLGDSRIEEGFSARAAAAATVDRIRFWNFGIAGTPPRVWFYMLRDGDPTRRRFATIVIPMDGYEDADRPEIQANRLIDLNFVIGRLSVSDCWDFAASIRLPEYKARALSGCLLRGITLRRDVQDFLQHIPDRIKRTKDNRDNGLAYLDGYGGMEESLHGLSADFVTRTINFPPGVNALRIPAIQARIMRPPPPKNGEMTPYRKLWLGRILDLYRDSPTRIVFLELPRAPIPIPESSQPARFLQWALKRPRVFALPQNTFRDLENPDLFFDGLHLNKIGRDLFSRKIASQVSPLIGIH